MPIDDGFDDAVLGRGLPADAEAALAQAGALRTEDPPRALALLQRARALAPGHPAVLIAFYRHHFYGHRIAAAREIAEQALPVAADALGLPRDWREVPAVPLPDARTGARTRFYLFLLKGYAYLSLRLGELDTAGRALDTLQALDPQDCVGARLIESVRQRALRGVDVYQEAYAEDTGTRPALAPDRGGR